MLKYQEQNPVNQEPSRFLGCVQVVTSKFVESNASAIPAAYHFTAPISITHFILQPSRYDLAQTHRDWVCCALFFLRVVHYRVSCCSILQNAALESCMLSCALQMYCIGKTSFPSKLIQFLQISLNIFPDSQR